MKSKSYTIEKFKSKEEWLKHRGIGGSDAAVIMGEGKWKTKYDLYNEVVLKRIPKDKKNSRMAQGVAAESHIRELFFIHNPQYKAIRPPKRSYWLFTSKENPVLTLTPDSLAKDKSDKLLFAEIKDMAIYSNKEVDLLKSGAIPSQYKYQCLHYFVVIKELVYGYLVINANIFEKVDNKWVYSHSEMLPLLITRAMWKQEIDELKKKEIEFANLKERPAIEFDLLEKLNG